MNIMTLAYKELIREGVLNKFDDNTILAMQLDRALFIKRWLDNQARNKKVAERKNYEI